MIEWLLMTTLTNTMLYMKLSIHSNNKRRKKGGGEIKNVGRELFLFQYFQSPPYNSALSDLRCAVGGKPYDG
jgi:hypothetical protein